MVGSGRQGATYEVAGFGHKYNIVNVIDCQLCGCRRGEIRNHVLVYIPIVCYTIQWKNGTLASPEPTHQSIWTHKVPLS